MKLHEYQSKQIFAKYGVPIPRGRVATTASEAKQIAEELGGRVVIKAQVLVGGRGKAGGIRLAKTPKEAEELATQILGMEIKGLPVRKVLVDEAVSIDQRDLPGHHQRPRGPQAGDDGVRGRRRGYRRSGCPHTRKRSSRCTSTRCWACAITSRAIWPSAIDLPREHLWRSFGEIAAGLWKAYVDCDATLAEINPLVITDEQPPAGAGRQDGGR